MARMLGLARRPSGFTFPVVPCASGRADFFASPFRVRSPRLFPWPTLILPPRIPIVVNIPIRVFSSFATIILVRPFVEIPPSQISVGIYIHSSPTLVLPPPIFIRMPTRIRTSRMIPFLRPTFFLHLHRFRPTFSLRLLRCPVHPPHGFFIFYLGQDPRVPGVRCSESA